MERSWRRDNFTMKNKSFKRNNSSDSIGSKAVLLTENYALPYEGVNNLNTIVISSVGTGKTRGFLKSNLLLKGCSFVVTDTKGDLASEFYFYLKQDSNNSEPYSVKILNLKNPTHSNHYNPFVYMKNEEDVVNFALALAVNVTKNPHDSFWLSSCTNLIASMCFFLFEAYEPEHQNIKSLMTIYNEYLCCNNDSSENLPIQIRHKNKYSEMMEYMPDNSLAKKFFSKCRAGDTTFYNMLATVGQALSVFEYTHIQNLMEFDDIDLTSVGEKRTALFINLDDTNPCYDFIAGLIYTQLFRVLYQQADSMSNYRLKEHVRFFMDDFANYKIPDLSHILSTCRSRGMSMEMLLQSESQLEALYGHVAHNIIANCVYIYMGSNDIKTQQNIASRLGKSLSEIQNATNVTYVFFPEGETIVDKKADYTKHKLYKNLYCHQTLNMNDFYEPQLQLGSVAWKNAMGCYCSINDILKLTSDSKRVFSSDSDWADDFFGIDTKDSMFDSDEESLFYNTLLPAIKKISDEYKLFVHLDLREIFTLDNTIRNKLKYKLMLMHCDFVIKNKDAVVCGIEIDGKQHQDKKQKENDEIKDEIFVAANIPLFRISAESIRQDCISEVEKIVKHIKNK